MATPMLSNKQGQKATARALSFCITAAAMQALWQRQQQQQDMVQHSNGSKRRSRAGRSAPEAAAGKKAKGLMKKAASSCWRIPATKVSVMHC